MKLTEQHIIKQNDDPYKDLMDIMHKSKNLYNATLYAIRQYFFKTNKYLDYYKVYNQFKSEHNPDFYSLPSGTAQQTMKLVDQNFKSFFALLKKKQQGKYEGKVRIPKYKDKNGYFEIVYTNDRFNKNYKSTNTIILQKTDIKLTGFKHLDTCKQLRLIPKNNYIQVELVYEVNNISIKSDNKRYMSIDLGINNLCTVSSNCINTFIVDGKKLKSINHYWNKQVSQLKSKLSESKYWSKLLSNITNNRNNRVKYNMHCVSKYIVNQAVENQINTIVIGQNKGWKQETNIGKKNNQNFTQIPHSNLVNMIKYKAELQCINVILQEESYTSKASFFDNDKIPVYKKDDEKVYIFSGKRVYRGLYKSKNGLMLNADVNGSLNILRKYLKCNCDEIISPADIGLVVNPVKVKIT